MNPLILLVNQFKKLGDTTKIKAYLDLQKKLLEFTGLKADDSRLSMSVRKEGDISININSRRVLGLVIDKKTWQLQIMINDSDLIEVKQLDGYISMPREREIFKNYSPTPASLLRFNFTEESYGNQRLIQLWQISVLDYLSTATGTPYRKSYNGCLFTATMDKQARQQLFSWIEKGGVTEKDLESDEIKKLFNLDDSTATPSVSDSNFTQNDNNMAFTWVKTHYDIVQYLKDRRAKQIELIDLLKKIGTDLFNDKDENGNNVALDEIDPFTFFCYIYKYGNKKRLEILQALAAEINSEPIPTDEFGIPSTNPQQVWLFPYKFKRKNNEINRLWDFFEKVITDTVDETSFIDVMKIKGVGQTKLTEVLFYVNPNKYFPINESIKQYLASKFDINHNFNTFSEYQMILNRVKAKTNAPFYQISYDAWKWNNSPKNNSLDMNNMKIEYPLNQILYGPPGTGKTYHTINKALAIIENKTEEELETEDRKDLKKRFDGYVTEGSIVFTTFHQSMSYEDFIEGIKPIEPQNEGDNMTYKVIDGIFKRLSFDASFAIAQQKKSENIVEIIDFSTQYEDYIGKIDERLLQGEKIKIKTKSNAVIFIDSISPNRNIIVRHIEGTRTYIVSKDRLTKIHQAFSELDDINNIDSQFRGVIGGSNASAYWAILNDIRKTPFDAKKSEPLKIYTQNEKKEVVASMLKSDFEYKNAEKPKPFVLIIDEINRGNVSQIFGELITLIEDDKRLGKDEALTVTLPYSKEKFGMPSNVYIIGTMNTADRSVEALDTALRRRFSFVEMPPQYDLDELDKEIGGFYLPDILQTMNDRIEVLLNRDNLIGHSYFLKVDSEEALKETMFKNIIPLLQEYFFGDYGKIGLVLGKGFVKEEKDRKKVSFATFDYPDTEGVQKTVYELRKYDEVDIEKAIKWLLNGKA